MPDAHGDEPRPEHRHAAAEERDRQASLRDVAADARDRQADAADVIAARLAARDAHVDAQPPPVGAPIAVRLKARATRAERAREQARRVRTASADDRLASAADRREARADREYASADDLTGAYRRSHGIEQLQREAERARRTGEPLSVSYVDVDGLKAVNDDLGHDAGDHVLREVVGAIQMQMRMYDLVVRMGGDEFLCIMPGTTEETARARFAAFAGPDGGIERAGRWTVSMGFAELRDDDDDEASSLVTRADRDLIDTRARFRSSSRRPARGARDER